jgi:hypothetical protein
MQFEPLIAPHPHATDASNENMRIAADTILTAISVSQCNSFSNRHTNAL